jgi:hypothetical protein
LIAVPRGLVIFGIVLAVLAGAGGARSAGGATPCAPSTEVKVHDEIVFGHFSTRSAAAALKRRAAAVGFQGIKIEVEGCGDYEVEQDGADTSQQRGSVATEARKAGFQVTFEQTAPPMEYLSGQVVGILGRFSSVAAANALMTKLATVNYRYIDLARRGSRWLVVMPQVPTKHALPIAHDVAAAGFHIQFQPGDKS